MAAESTDLSVRDLFVLPVTYVSIGGSGASGRDTLVLKRYGSRRFVCQAENIGGVVESVRSGFDCQLLIIQTG